MKIGKVLSYCIKICDGRGGIFFSETKQHSSAVTFKIDKLQSNAFIYCPLTYSGEIMASIEINRSFSSRLSTVRMFSPGVS